MESKKETIVIRYGGNAMTDPAIRGLILDNIAEVHATGHTVILVHGGGPYINKLLDSQHIESEFIAGHRKTTTEAVKFIEMALTGEVNPELVRALQSRGVNAVGLSGKDGELIVAEKKYHQASKEQIDIGWVGDVVKVNPEILETLIGSDYVPVITCMASDEEGNAYNINGDMVAGHIAGAVKADRYIVMTDIDGLLADITKPESLISALSSAEVAALMGKVIKGGMIPKIDSCLIAIANGAVEARIINGTKPDLLVDLVVRGSQVGTKISK